MMTKDDLPDVWTDKHDKELKFNAGNQLSRVFEHMRSGAITADEVPPEVVALCTAFYDDKVSTMMKREGAEKRVKRLVCRAPPRDTEVSGLRVYVEDDALSGSVAVGDAIADMEWSRTHEPSDARAFLVVDVENLDPLMKIAAGLSGGWVTDSRALTGRGAWIKFKNFSNTKRYIHITNLFRHEYFAVAFLIEKVIEKTTAMKGVADLEEWARLKERATAQKRPAEVILLRGYDEGDKFCGVPHCFNLPEFVKFATAVDVEHTCVTRMRDA